MGKRITIGKKREFKKLPPHGLLNQDEITWYLENDLDLNRYYYNLERKIEDGSKK